LRSIPDLQTNSVSTMAESLFSKLGVDWESPKGKSVFFNDRLGLLFVKATESDLDTIERAIQALNQVGPQVHIKARFIEVPKKTLTALRIISETTNDALEILNSEKADELLQTLYNEPSVEILAEPEVITISGRHTQIRATQIINIITNFAFQEKWANQNKTIFTEPIVPQSSELETGPVLDVIPHVLPDGYTIDLKTTASVTTFFGYADPTNFYPRLATNSAGEKIILPVVLPAAQLRRASAQMRLYDGQTLVLSGLQPEQILFSELDRERDKRVAEHIQQAEAKSESKTLIVLVTAMLVDPAGNRIHSDDDMPFAQHGIPSQPAQSPN